jgi:hypothetical protein
MQNENTPAEGNDSAQPEAESALRDAACSSLHDVLNAYTELTYFGFGKLNGFGKPWTDVEFLNERRCLQKASEEVDAVREWIKRRCCQRKTYNLRVSSYGLKHSVERDVNRYISNGSCIAAFILEGYRVKQPEGWGPNCVFNVKFLTNVKGDAPGAIEQP